MALKSYRSLDAWTKAMELVEAVYRMTRTFPPEERFGLTSQIQRAAVSVPANIAEGYGRGHRGEYVHHLFMARGSLQELETLLTIAARLKVTSRSTAMTTWQLAQSVSKLLHGLIVSLKQPQTPDPRP